MTFSCSLIAISLVSTYIGMLEYAIDLIQSQKKDILNGNKKQKLIQVSVNGMGLHSICKHQWWLDLIREKCEAFLTSRGYDFEAVPQVKQCSHSISENTFRIIWILHLVPLSPLRTISK